MPKSPTEAPPVAVVLSPAVKELISAFGSDNVLMDLTARIISSAASHLEDAVMIKGHPGLMELQHEGYKLIFFEGTAQALAQELKTPIKVPEKDRGRSTIFIIAALRKRPRGAD